MDDKIGLNGRDLLQGYAGALGLHAARFKFEGAVTNVNHVMRIGDDHAFKLSGGRWVLSKIILFCFPFGDFFIGFAAQFASLVRGGSSMRP